MRHLRARQPTTPAPCGPVRRLFRFSDRQFLKISAPGRCQHEFSIDHVDGGPFFGEPTTSQGSGRRCKTGLGG